MIQAFCGRDRGFANASVVNAGHEFLRDLQLPYSVLNELTGLANADLTVLIPSVVKAIISVARPETAITVIPGLIWYAKFCSHSFVAYQPNGIEMAQEIITSTKNSFESSVEIWSTFAPSTFRIPISFVLLSTVYDMSANNPSDAITIEMVENTRYNLAKRSSCRYEF